LSFNYSLSNLDETWKVGNLKEKIEEEQKNENDEESKEEEFEKESENKKKQKDEKTDDLVAPKMLYHSDAICRTSASLRATLRYLIRFKILHESPLCDKCGNTMAFDNGRG